MILHCLFLLLSSYHYSTLSYSSFYLFSICQSVSVRARDYVYVCVCVCVGRARVLACVRACVFPILILSFSSLFEWIMDERERIIYSCSFCCGLEKTDKRTDRRKENKCHTTLISTPKIKRLTIPFLFPLFLFLPFLITRFSPPHLTYFSMKTFLCFLFLFHLGVFLSLLLTMHAAALMLFISLTTVLFSFIITIYLFIYSFYLCIVLQ